VRFLAQEIADAGAIQDVLLSLGIDGSGQLQNPPVLSLEA
jgi:hypothetical protein